MAEFANVTNGFAYLGAADIISRGVAHISSKASRIYAAPQTHSRLVAVSQGIKCITAEARAYVKGLENSVVGSEDDSTEFESTLSTCHQETESLGAFLRATEIHDEDGFIQRCAKRVKIAANEDGIRETCHYLEAHKSNIVAMSVVSGNKNTAALRNDLHDARIGLQNKLSTVETKVDNTHRLLEKHLAPSNVNNHTEFRVLQGLDVENLIIPLMTFKRGLPGLLQKLCSETNGQISEKDISWVTDEFITTLSSAHRLAATELEDERIESDIYSSPAKRAKDKPWRRRRPRCMRFNRSLKPRSTCTPAPQISKRKPCSCSMQLGNGTCVMDYTMSNICARGIRNCQTTVQLRFSYIPHLWPFMESKGFLGIFSRDLKRTPRVSRFIQEINVIPATSEAFQAAERNDVQRLRNLFKLKMASPFDYDENGRSLLWVAAVCQSEEVMDLLLRENADPHNCQLGAVCSRELSSALWGDIKSQHGHNTKSAIRKAMKMTVQAVIREYDIESGLENEPLTASWTLTEALELLLRCRKMGQKLLLLVYRAIKEKLKGRELLVPFLNEQSGCIRVTKRAVQAAIKDPRKPWLPQLSSEPENLEDILRYILDHQDIEVKDLEDLIQLSIQVFKPELFVLLLYQCQSKPELAQFIIAAVFKNSRFMSKVLELLRDNAALTCLEYAAQPVESAVEVDDGASTSYEPAKNQPRAPRRMSWRRSHELRKRVLKILNTDLQVSNQVLARRTRSSNYGFDVITLVVDCSHWQNEENRWNAHSPLDQSIKIVELYIDPTHDRVHISCDEVKIESKRCNCSSTENITDSGEQITEDFLLSVIRYCPPLVLELLLRRQGLDLPITEEVVCLAASKESHWYLELLLHFRRSQIRVTPALVQKAQMNPNPNVIYALYRYKDETGQPEVSGSLRSL